MTGGWWRMWWCSRKTWTPLSGLQGNWSRVGRHCMRIYTARLMAVRSPRLTSAAGLAATHSSRLLRRRWKPGAATVSRMLVNEPARVWEIGCGTGLLLLGGAALCLVSGHGLFGGGGVSLRAEVASRAACKHVQAGVVWQMIFPVLRPSSSTWWCSTQSSSIFRVRHISRRVLRGGGGDAGRGRCGVHRRRAQPAAAGGVSHRGAAVSGAADVELAQVRERVQRALEIEEEELVLDPEYFRGLCQAVPLIACRGAAQARARRQ